MFSFKQIVDYAIPRRLPIIAAGDLIDVQNPDAWTIKGLRNLLGKLNKAKIPFYYTQGQHEMSAVPWLSAVHAWPTHVHEKIFQIGEFKFYGLDFQTADKLPEALSWVPEVNGLVCHQVWEEFMGDHAVCEGSLTQVPSVDFVLTGDYHKHLVREVINADGQKVTVYSPGSSNLREISEPPYKQFFVLYDSGHIKSHDLLTRAVLTPPVIESNEAMDHFLAHVEDQIKKAEEFAKENKYPLSMRKPILYVKTIDLVEDVERRIKRVVADKAHLFLKELRTETPERSEVIAQREQIRKSGMLGLLNQAVVKGSQGYADIARLLSAENPKLELQQMRAEAGLTEITNA